MIETKAPGNTPTAAQWAFLRLARECGAVALVIDDLAVFDLALARLMVNPAVMLGWSGEPEAIP